MPDEPLSFPYCAPCKAHLRAAQDRRTSNLVALNLAIWGVGLPLAAGLPAVALIPGPALAAWLFWKNTGRQLAANVNCTAEGDAAKATWVKKQTYRFTFSRKETAQAFLDLNRDSLSDR
jgi:hypothetical protein